jgi:hypothetical protein
VSTGGYDLTGTWGSNFVLFAGQVVASAWARIAVIPLMRRREKGRPR